MKNNQSLHYAIQSFTEAIFNETSSFPLLKQLHFRLQINTRKDEDLLDLLDVMLLKLNKFI